MTKKQYIVKRSDRLAAQGESNFSDMLVHNTKTDAFEKNSNTLSLEQLLRHKTYGCISTSIGDLCIFCLTPKNQMNLHKSLGKDIKKCLPYEYVKKLSKYICYPKESLLEGEYMPKSVMLTDDDIAGLCSDDLDAISKKYFENNKKLNREQSRIVTDGIKVYPNLNATISPKEDIDSWTEYLYKLSVLEIEEIIKQRYKPFFELSCFFVTLNKQIEQAIQWGNKYKSIDHNAHASDILETNMPHLKNNHIGQKLLNKLVDLKGESNKSDTVIIDQLKEARDNFSKSSKQSFTFNIIVAVVMFIIGGVTLYYTALPSFDKTPSKDVIEPKSQNPIGRDQIIQV